MEFVGGDGEDRTWEFGVVPLGNLLTVVACV